MEEIFDPLRRKRVALTPEENVRQQFIRYLNEKRDWPLHMMMSETEISLGDVRLRCDVVCYTKNKKANSKAGAFVPKMIVECKRPSVKITSKTFEQIWHYALILKVEYIAVTNGKQTFACRYDQERKQYVFITDIPAYGTVIVEQKDTQLEGKQPDNIVEQKDTQLDGKQPDTGEVEQKDTHLNGKQPDTGAAAQKDSRLNGKQPDTGAVK